MSLISAFSPSRLFPKVGVDLGSSRTRIWLEGKGVCLDQPTCLAFDRDSRRVVAIGSDAALMTGRVGKNISVVWPVAGGSVADPDSLESLLKLFFQKITLSQVFSQPIVMVSTSSELTSVARDTLVGVLYQTGAREVYTIAQPLAASIGAGVPIADASGSFVLQMGAGVVEATATSFGSVVHTTSTTRAGNYLTQKIQAIVKQLFELDIAHDTAEELQRRVTSVTTKTHRELLITGQDSTTKSPRERVITSDDLKKTVTGVLKRYEGLLRRLLSELPPELTVDVIDKGLLLSGAFAQLDGVDAFFVRALGVPVSVVDKPDHAVVLGIGSTLQNLDQFKESLGYQL